MAYKKANLTFLNNTIICIGDPIQDIWIAPDGSQKVFPGGAWNVYSNLKYFTKNVLPIFPEENWLEYYFKNNQKISPSVYGLYKPLSSNIKSKTIICSDYNKGFLKNSIVKLDCDLLIVDSKYATISKSLLQNSKTKILKITETDNYTKDFLNLFDYTIVTNAGSNISLYRGLKKIASYSVPKIEVKSTVGAGDVFLATLGYYLTQDIFLELKDNLNYAIYKAIDYATQSIAYPYTSNLNYME